MSFFKKSRERNVMGHNSQSPSSAKKPEARDHEGGLLG